MVYRPVDNNGDMMPVTSADQMLTGVDAVMGAVHSRLRLLLGEWWEDPALGFRVPDFLFTGSRLPAGPEMLAGYISSYIGQTENVTAVTDVSAVLENRVLSYYCRIETPFGDMEGSVDQDVLLRAVY